MRYIFCYNIKRITLCTLLTLAIFVGLSSFSFAQSPNLKDLAQHWSNTYVQKLVHRKAIHGYPDGTFRPEESISIAAFTKILVSTLGYDNLPNGPQHWADHYMAKAKELFLILPQESEFNALDTAITRGQIARMVSRAMTETYSEPFNYPQMITDYPSIKLGNREAVLMMFRSGIITGYPDGTFKDSGRATRAEASTMVMRFLESDLRILPVLPYVSGIVVSESDDVNRYDFYISVYTTKNLEPQYIEVESYLTSKVGAQLTADIMAHVKKKTFYRDALEGKTFKWGAKGEVYVASMALESIILIRGDDGVE